DRGKPWENKAIEDGAVGHALRPDAALHAQEMLQPLFGETSPRFELIGLLRSRPSGPTSAGLSPGNSICHIKIVALSRGDDDVEAALGQLRIDLHIAPADDI